MTSAHASKRSVCTWLLSLAALALPAAAAADDPLARGVDPVASKPAATMSGLLTLEGARVETERSFSLALDADLVDGLLGLKIGDDRVGELIERRLDLHVTGAYVIADGVELAVDVPFTAWQRNGFGRLEDETGFPASAPAGSGFGDARLLGKVRLLDEARAPLSAALVAELRAPTGDGDSFLGERGWVAAPRLAVERTFGDLRVAGEAGYRWREAPGRFLNLYAGDEFTLGVGGSYRLPALGFLKRWSALAELNGATPARSPAVASGDALQNALEALAGLRVGLGGCFEATVAGGTGFSVDGGVGREAWRVLTGVRCVRISHDRDGDGLDDDEDTCPDAAEDRDGFQDTDGCPDPDNDADGLPDDDDLCPDRAGPPEYDGCPDTDGDEIPDPEDRCPKEPGPAKRDGCPVKGPPYVTVEKDRIELEASVRFDSGRDTVTADSKPVLDEVAATLTAHPELVRVRVEGHTDSQGSDTFNLDLSRRRARAVKEQLVRRGVSAERLDSEGYGEERPVADNGTALGRAKNRRVELTIVERR